MPGDTRGSADKTNSSAWVPPVDVPMAMTRSVVSAIAVAERWPGADKIASALKATKLIFLTDQNGILDADKNLIESADYETLQSLLKTETVSGGMYTKVLTVVDALINGVSQVRILRGTQACDGLWSDEVGTMCTMNLISQNQFFDETLMKERISC